MNKSQENLDTFSKSQLLDSAKQSNQPLYHISDSNPSPGSWIERILNPRAVQWMMVCGGSVLVLGFVGWLWTIGVFENPITVALAIGGATLGTMLAGIGLFRMSEHKQAGMGLTLLACLAMPLNLWFYHAQGLITLSAGGHLWIPAAICCGIYAIVARTLRQPAFVFTLVGGIVMTGMLFLADQDVGRFFELLSPVTFLVTTGWICIFSNRMFADSDSDFSRDKFGRAFQHSGMLVLMSGLVILAAGQVSGLLNGFLFTITELPAVTSQWAHQLWALAVIGISAAGCVIQFTLEENKRRRTSWLISGGVFGIWAIATLIDALAFQLTLSHLSILAGGALIAANLLTGHRLSQSRQMTDDIVASQENDPIGIWLATLFIASMAVFQFLAQFTLAASFPLLASSGWIVVVQILVAAAACWTLPLQTRKYTAARIREVSFYESLAAFLATLATCSAILLTSISSFQTAALVLLVVPAAFRIFVKQRIHSKGNLPLTSPATAAAITTVICLFGMDLLEFHTGTMLIWSWIMALVAAFCLRWTHRNPVDETFGCLSGIASITLLFGAMNWPTDIAMPIALTFVGVLMSVINHIRLSKQSADPETGIVNAIQPLPSGLLMVAGSVCGILLALARSVVGEVEPNVIWVLCGQLVGLAVAAVTTQVTHWRLTYRNLAIGTVIALALSLNSWLAISLVHRLELGSLIVGLGLLVIGHIGWAREGRDKDQGVTASLSMGSLMIVIPLAIGLVGYRVFDGSVAWMTFHEIAAIVAAFALIGTGVACQIRSTTLSGAALLTIYILSLITLITLPTQLKSVSVIMMVGGGIFFTTAILMSIFRDRLQKLPQQIRDKKGVFRVMRWR